MREGANRFDEPVSAATVEQIGGMERSNNRILATYSSHEANISIETAKVIFPRLVKESPLAHRSELENNWQTGALKHDD